MNPCSSSECIFKPDQCSSQPTPAPMPPAPAPGPSTTGDATKIVEKLLQLLKIDDVDAQACVSDVGGSVTKIRSHT